MNGRQLDNIRNISTTEIRINLIIGEIIFNSLIVFTSSITSQASATLKLPLRVRLKRER